MCRNTATVICCRRCGYICSLIVREMSGMEGLLAPVQRLLNLPPLFGLSLPCWRETAIGTCPQPVQAIPHLSSPVCLGSPFFYVHLSLGPHLLCSFRFPYLTKLLTSCYLNQHSGDDAPQYFSSAAPLKTKHASWHNPMSHPHNNLS